MRRIFLSLALALLACGKDEPKSTRWAEAGAAAVAQTATAPTASATATGSLNRYFPKDGDGGYKRVFTADKEGYAEAKLQKDGKDVATLTIADTNTAPEAREKFKSASEKLDAFPLMKVGNNQSSALIKDRFQVKVSSPTLDHEARKAILATFDLKGLGT